MDLRDTLIRMLRQLLVDMQNLQQLGSGYYTCTPIAKRFNKLLEQARTLFPAGQGVIVTFDPISDVDPKDPADKAKTVQGIRIEISQLISLLECAAPNGAAGGGSAR